MTREEARNILENKSCVDCAAMCAYPLENPEGCCEYADAIRMAIKALQEQKTGKWIGGEHGFCTCCGHEGCASDIWDRCTYTFCPNCGAKLEVEGIS